MLSNPCRLEPASTPLPVAPQPSQLSHLFSAAALLSALHCTASQILFELSASSLFQSTALPHQSNRWHCCHLQEAVWVLSEVLQLLSGLCRLGGKMGGGKGRESRSASLLVAAGQGALG